MDTFNPKILDASIRDVSSHLAENQKVDLLLYAMRSMQIDSRSRTVIENAIQSCLQVSTLSPENKVKARVLRARARCASGNMLSAQEDLHAALAADPDNHEAKALLHQRSVTVEKLLAPLPKLKERISNEIWREIALYLPKGALKTLLFVPHAISRIASQLLFSELDLHFGPQHGDKEHFEEYGHHSDGWYSGSAAWREEDARRARRSADILTRIIVDGVFASAVRTLRIFAVRRESDGMAFQTGMLMNALPKLINLRSIHLSATTEGVLAVLKVLQLCSLKLHGLSLHSPDGPADLSFLEFRHLTNFAYTTTGGNPTSIHNFVSQNRITLRTLSLESTHPSIQWTLPTQALSIRNLTALHFTGHFPAASHAFAEVLANGRQLETFNLSCHALECSTVSFQFRNAQHTHPLPFLRNFAFTVHSVGRRCVDRDLFPAIAEFLRGRSALRTLQLLAYEGNVQHAVGFHAAIWGVLPSLEGLRGLAISYPADLAPGLAAWLIPRRVTALALVVDPALEGVGAGAGGIGGGSGGYGKDWVSFLNQLRQGIPPALRFVAFLDTHLPLGLDTTLHNPASIVEHGFPMVRVLRVGGNYYSVPGNVDASVLNSGGNTAVPKIPRTIGSSGGTTVTSAYTIHHSRSGLGLGSRAIVARPTPSPPSFSSAPLVIGHPPSSSPASTPMSSGSSVSVSYSHTQVPGPSSTGTSPGHFHPSSSHQPCRSHGSLIELELWPRRRVAYHVGEWLEWFGCEDAIGLGGGGGSGEGWS